MSSKLAIAIDEALALGQAPDPENIPIIDRVLAAHGWTDEMSYLNLAAYIDAAFHAEHEAGGSFSMRLAALLLDMGYPDASVQSTPKLMVKRVIEDVLARSALVHTLW